MEPAIESSPAVVPFPSAPAAARRGSSPRILAFATQGSGGGDEARLQALLSRLPVELVPFERERKARMLLSLVGALARKRPELVVMEGTGVAGGLALLVGRVLFGTRYVVSSGDAVGPFVASRAPLLGPLFELYERALCLGSAGYIGWTPYLVGRALTFGAPRGMTAAGWAPQVLEGAARHQARREVRARLRIPDDALVAGLVGSLVWSPRVGYAYGIELVHAIRRTPRADLRVLVVGGGDGLDHLRRAAQGDPRVLLTGPVERSQVPRMLAAMDVASLPQSVDQLGGFRYTTKVSEYLAAGLPILTTQIPLAYDVAGEWAWRLRGEAPWDERFLEALAGLLSTLDLEAVEQRRRAVPVVAPEFHEQRQVERVTQFLCDLLEQATAPEAAGVGGG
jgi:glycosyltransferase involved in cell wall biosynthesis